mgnify:CR=1 FL=1
MGNVHSTAIVDESVTLGADVTIGPFCVVTGDVTLGDGVVLESHVVVTGNTRIGDETHIYPFASIGHVPQDLKFGNEDVSLEIGARNRIREHVTMNPGTEGGGAITKVGNDGLFMMGAHVAHDCVVGDNAIFANNAALGGHVKIGHNVMLGGFASVQQWCRVGDHAMVGSQSAVDADVIPFAIAVGNRASLTGINVIGLERRGFDAIDVDLLRQVFRDLFHRDGLFSERLGRLRDIYKKNPLVGHIVSFIDGAGKNGICKTASKVTKRG